MATEVWAHEYVFEKSTSIPQMVNESIFFLTAATCDFGRYDVPGTQSSTELMLLKEVWWINRDILLQQELYFLMRMLP